MPSDSPNDTASTTPKSDYDYDEDSLRAIAHGEHPDFVYIDSEKDEDRRWTRTVRTISMHKASGNLVALQYEEGLTECQENIYFRQPYPVEKHEEIIPAHTVTRYRKASP